MRGHRVVTDHAAAPAVPLLAFSGGMPGAMPAAAAGPTFTDSTSISLVDPDPGNGVHAEASPALGIFGTVPGAVTLRRRRVPTA